MSNEIKEQPDRSARGDKSTMQDLLPADARTATWPRGKGKKKRVYGFFIAILALCVDSVCLKIHQVFFFNPSKHF